MPQPLSTKESNLFRQIIKHYDEKQYKRGLKTAEQILRKNPRHGDTMAMKALILNAQGKTEEAFSLGKEALQADMKSHMCWHVYGLLYRANKNFEEAIKAYKFALRLEPESPQIQRDLATLQIQMRDYQGYIQTRRAILQSRPQLRQNWTALATAHHLAGNLRDAENILTTYEGTLKVQPGKFDLEHSESLMYRNMIIAEMGDTERALEHLESACKANLDRMAFMESRAKYLSQLGKKEEAQKVYRALVDRNPDHPEYYYRLEETLGLEDGDTQARRAIYDEYAEKYPRSDVAKRIPLDFLTGDDFREAAQKYLTLMFNKGVPSTFANIKHLYTDSAKRDVVPGVVQAYLDSQESGNGVDEKTNGDVSKGKAAALYFLAQHYNFPLSCDLTKAMEYIDKAIEMDSTSVEYAMTRARIWKHRGNIPKAAEAMDQARTIDTRDRYVNTKTAKYQLRNNENEKALATMGLFTRADTIGGPLVDLLDMQCIWYLTEDSEAYARRGNTGMALKRLHSIWDIFETWQEDQFDFHNFSFRRGMARAYIDMIRWEDYLREHPFYSRAALDAVRIYLGMYDRKAGTGAANGVNGAASAGDAEGQDAAEARKAAKKAKREAQRLEKEAAERAAKENPNKGKPLTAKEAEAAKKKDEDPLGLKLAATTDPLGDVMKFLNPLLQLSPKLIEVQLVGFEVYLRRKKYILALKCLNAAKALDPEHPKVHEQTVALRAALHSADTAIPLKVAEVLKADFTVPAAGTDLKAFNGDFRARHADSPVHVIAAASVDRTLGAGAGAEEVVASILDLTIATPEDAVAALETLNAWHAKDAATAFRASAAKKWPDVSAFA